MAKESKHAKTSDLSRSLCDLLLACFPQDYAASRNYTETWCGAHIQQRKAALYWVLHSKEHIQVFLRCQDTPEIRSGIIDRLPDGVTLRARPFPRKANWAISTPLFLYIRTEEQAKGMCPLLRYLSDSRPDSYGSAKPETNRFWHPPSEGDNSEMAAEEEGAKTSVLVNKYERNRKNRELCIRAHGTLCSVCGFDFSVAYGEIGKGYIHVHHLTSLAALKGKARKIDPVKELRPVCPNCHEMLHRCDPPYTVDRLKEIIEDAKNAGHRLLASNSGA